MEEEQEQRNKGSVFNEADEFKIKHIQMNGGIWKTVILKTSRCESGQKVRNALGT